MDSDNEFKEVLEAPASTLCFLSDLASKSVRSKVRFLGCVTEYDVNSGVLTLQHEYPRHSRDRARVDVDLVLGQLTTAQVQVGEWINVIGYVTGVSTATGTASSDIHVQALVVWSAGPLNVQIYEKRLVGLLDRDALLASVSAAGDGV